MPKMSDEAGASWDRVSADYLQNFGMRALRGRDFSKADNETAAPVAIVNQAFVKRFFKSGEDPLGQHFGLDLPQNAGTFVGRRKRLPHLAQAPRRIRAILHDALC